jgi:hypothetical protein
MKSNSTQMAKPAMAKPVFRQTAVVGSTTKAGVTYRTTSGTKAYSMPKDAIDKHPRVNNPFPIAED